MNEDEGTTWNGLYEKRDDESDDDYAKRIQDQAVAEFDKLLSEMFDLMHVAWVATKEMWDGLIKTGFQPHETALIVGGYLYMVGRA